MLWSRRLSPVLLVTMMLLDCMVDYGGSSPARMSTNDVEVEERIQLDLDELTRMGFTKEQVMVYLRQIMEGDYTCRDALRTMRRYHLRNQTIVCNDGSRPGYYLRKSFQSSKWLIFLEGGGFCFDRTSCERRWNNTHQFMSSRGWSERITGTGILSPDPEENPYYFNINMVYVPYCSSDSWSGTHKAQKAGDYSFMGALIVESVINELVNEHGVASAKRLLLTGTSAGGTGVMLNLDHISWVMSRVAPDVEVRGISDSGWFLDNAPYRTSSCHDSTSCDPVQSAQRGIQYWHGRVPKLCEENHPTEEKWRCYFAHRIYPTLKTPVFVIQHLFDEAQLTADNVGFPVKREQWRYIHNVGEEMRQTLQNVSAIFAPACLSHILVTKRNWRQVAINGVTLPQALKCWEDGHHEINRYKTSRKQRKQVEVMQAFTTGDNLEQSTSEDHHTRTKPEKRTEQKQSRKKKRRKRRKQRKRARNRCKEEETTRRGRQDRSRESSRHSSRERREVLVGDGYVAESTHGRTIMSSPAELYASSSSIRQERSLMAFNQHDMHHIRYHDNQCRHHGVDQCAWPQCNLSCPKIQNPFTGEEMDFIDLLLQFDLDLSSIANALGMDLATLQTMDHDMLLQLLIQQR